MPGKSIPKIEWLALLSFDKFVHASIFFVLQLLWMRGLFLQTSFTFFKNHFKIIPLVCCIVYGGILEIMQSLFFSERSGDVLDFIANSVGCIAGVFLFGKLKKVLRVF
jgi:VanZ family protein